MNTIRFDHYTPPPPLSRFVEVFWYWEGYNVAQGIERVLPSPGTELVISLRDPRCAVVSGCHSKPFFLERTEADSLIGIHFHPGGAFPFLGLPADQIHNETVSLADLWGSSALDELRDRVLLAPTVREKFSALESWLQKKAALPLARHPAVRFALRQLRQGSDLPMAALADEVSLSQRRFIQVFKKEVGLTPKLFHRVSRFLGVVSGLEEKTEVDWTDVALSHGYFDQSHFIHEFSEFSGIRPSEYLDRRTAHLGHLRD